MQRSLCAKGALRKSFRGLKRFCVSERSLVQAPLPGSKKCLCAKAAQCKGFCVRKGMQRIPVTLCVKDALRNGFCAEKLLCVCVCVKAFVCKAALCKSFSVLRLPCVKAPACKSFVCACVKFFCKMPFLRTCIYV